MSVAAAIRITSAKGARIVQHAAAYARKYGVACYVFSVVKELPYGRMTEPERAVLVRNLQRISELNVSPVMQEGDDVPRTLLAVAAQFRVRTLFLDSGTSRVLSRSVVERLIYLKPPFDVVVVADNDTT